MAVTGPFEIISNVPGDRRQKVWFRGGKKLRIPLYHANRWCTGTRRNLTVGTTTTGDYYSDIRLYHRTIQAVKPPEYPYVYSKAYDRFVSKAHSQAKASIGTTLAEVSESLAMVHKRASQLVDFGKALRKRDFGGVVRALGLSETQKVDGSRKRTRDRKTTYNRVEDVWKKQAVKPASFANNYLEFVFGWAPLVEDIRNAVKVLGREFKSGNVVATAKDVVREDWQSSFYKPTGQPDTFDTFEQTCIVRLQARIRVSNPNVLLASELGLINPVQVAWQVVPFSFLIDTFVPIGKFLGSFTDFAGLEVERPFVSLLVDIKTSSSSRYYGWPYNAHDIDEVAQGYNFVRDLEMFTVPTLMSRVGLPTSNLLGRAASTVALLVQQLNQRK